MTPQWLGIKERNQGVPKDKISQYNIDDQEAVLLFDNRTIGFTIKHDPKMLVPILNVNPGIKNCHSFQLPFASLFKIEKRSNACLNTE